MSVREIVWRMCGGVGEKKGNGFEVGETVDMVARWGEPSQLAYQTDSE